MLTSLLSATITYPLFRGQLAPICLTYQQNLNEVVGYFDSYQDLVAFNLSSRAAYGILKPIFDSRTKCQTTSKGTWPDLHIDTGKVLNPSRCLTRINRFLYLYRNVRLSVPVEAVTSFMHVIGPSQAVNFELSFPQAIRARGASQISSGALESLLEASRL
jgi:hypothetical protein